MQDLIKTFLRQAAELWHRAQLESIAGECLRLDAARNPRNTDAANLLEANKHRNKAARELLATGRELATRLEAAGQDSTPLLTFLHTLDAAGGPEAAAPLWGPLKISLLTERNRSRNKAARERWLATREGLPHSGDPPPTANLGREWFNVASWPLYPFGDRPQRLPPEKPPFTFNDMLAGKRYRPPEETNREGSPTPGGTVRLERAGVVVELYFPTDADQETLAAALPGCDLDAPPWHAIQARLVAAGLSADWQGLTAPAAVAMLTRTTTDTPPRNATPGKTQGEVKDGQTQGTAPAPDDPLCERAQLVLQVLWKENAVASDDRVTTAEIVETAGGTDSVPYKTVIADLRERGYVRTKEGRGGGVWLTEKGKERAAKL